MKTLDGLRKTEERLVTAKNDTPGGTIVRWELVKKIAAIRAQIRRLERKKSEMSVRITKDAGMFAAGK